MLLMDLFNFGHQKYKISTIKATAFVELTHFYVFDLQTEIADVYDFPNIQHKGGV